MKAKQKLIALASPAPQMIDEEAEAVRDQTLSDAYSASEPLDDSDQAQRRDQTEIQAWEDVGLKHAGEMGEQHADPNQGGAISPHLLQAPVTAADDDVSGDEEMEFPSSSHNIQPMYLYMVIVQNFRRWMMIQWLLQRAKLLEKMVMCIRWQKLKFAPTTSLR